MRKVTFILGLFLILLPWTINATPITFDLRDTGVVTVGKNRYTGPYSITATYDTQSVTKKGNVQSAQTDAARILLPNGVSDPLLVAPSLVLSQAFGPFDALQLTAPPNSGLNTLTFYGSAGLTRSGFTLTPTTPLDYKSPNVLPVLFAGGILPSQGWPTGMGDLKLGLKLGRGEITLTPAVEPLAIFLVGLGLIILASMRLKGSRP
jgi:hypothetical protein